MGTDGIRHAAEKWNDSKFATLAFKGAVGVLLTLLLGLSKFCLDGQYETHAALAAQGAQIQMMSIQLDKLAGLFVSGQAERDTQMAGLNDKLDAIGTNVAIHDQSIREIRSHLGQDDNKLADIWGDVATLRGALKR
jgi:hypothetical protein